MSQPDHDKAAVEAAHEPKTVLTHEERKALVRVQVAAVGFGRLDQERVRMKTWLAARDFYTAALADQPGRPSDDRREAKRLRSVLREPPEDVLAEMYHSPLLAGRTPEVRALVKLVCVRFAERLFEYVHSPAQPVTPSGPEWEIVALPDTEVVERLTGENQRAVLEYFLKFTGRVGRVDREDENRRWVADDGRVCFTARLAREQARGAIPRCVSQDRDCHHALGLPGICRRCPRARAEQARADDDLDQGAVCIASQALAPDEFSWRTKREDLEADAAECVRAYLAAASPKPPTEEGRA